MGLGTRRHILPAATESSILDSAEDTGLGTDIATDISRRTDKTSHTIPEDGSPITVATKLKNSNSGKLTERKDHSQTSLLIEYYDGGKDPHSFSRHPSVRVRVTPSNSKKARESKDSHIVVTEANARRPSYSRKISLGSSQSPVRVIDPGSVSSLESLGHPRSGRAPVDIELVGKDSDISATSHEAQHIILPSDVSSMPADSMLEAPLATHRERLANTTNATMMDQSSLQAPLNMQHRNASNERFTQKVIEKLSNKPRQTSSGRRRHSEKNRSRSTSQEVRETEAEARVRSNKLREDDEYSQPTNSMVSAERRSNDQVSYRSGASQVSLTNNPKLLRTVEDAIRRLIMPELEEIKKKQKVSKSSKYDRDSSEHTESSVSREEVGHEISSGSRRRRRRTKEADLDSPSERSYRRRESVDSLSADEHVSHSRNGRDGHRVRDTAAAGLAGAALTAAALKHHGSAHSPEREERRRRRRRSKSRSSRSASLADGDEVFRKHDVPPMPMRSDLDSEVTRSSLLSSKTGDTLTPTNREVREVSRNSMQEASSPASQTPTRTPADLRKALGTHHGNLSERNLSVHNLTTQSEHSEDIYDKSSPGISQDLMAKLAAGGLSALAAHDLIDDPERIRKYESNLHQQHPIRRGLSPIQSVASYQTTEPNRNSVMQKHSVESFDSPKKHKPSLGEMSIESLSSARSTDFAKGKRPTGINLESPSEIMGMHDQQGDDRHRDLDTDEFFDEQHSQNDRYRDSFASSDTKFDARRMTNYTDDSTEEPYLDKVTSTRQVARGYGANPEYVNAPAGVESAVASLYEPSMVSGGDEHSPMQSSFTESYGRREVDSPRSVKQGYRSGGGSPLKEQQFAYSQEELPSGPLAKVMSPQQRSTKSLEQLDRDSGFSQQTNLPLHEHNAVKSEEQDATSPQSEITTNPSPIQGPAGAVPFIDHEHWPSKTTSPQLRQVLSPQSQSRDVGIMGTGDISKLGSSTFGLPRRSKTDIYSSSAQVMSTPPGAKADEGYVTGDNPRSPRYSPGPMVMSAPAANVGPGTREVDEDPFTYRQNGYATEFSQAARSPLYDSVGGHGIEGIQSQDVVALMDHLTVRDAQRNARDTEILVTLVRSAAEMRNSFEDMQKFIAEQNEFMMDNTDKQHEKTQKVVGGPRPQPPPAARFNRSISEDEDATAKRRNVFKRALQGLGSKNTRELQNIEQMMMHLLGEVEAMRAAQDSRTPPISSSGPGMNALASVDTVRAPTDTGYEPEGQAGTSSTGDRSGIFSNNSSRQADYRGFRRDSRNRVSTVMEDDEYDEPEMHRPSVDTSYRDPKRNAYDSMEAARGTAVPGSTPPRLQQLSNPKTAENTPSMSVGDSGYRKHKSTASSFLPRISRWSKTTASSVADNFRTSNQNTNQQRRDTAESQSMSDADEFEYDHQGDDRLRSNTSLQNDQYNNEENRPPSPLIPSQLSEKPKYQAHRNSLNLQHPQPRQGPTGRYQHHLETEAVNYDQDPFSPTSQTSSQWDRHVGPADAGQQAYVNQPPLSPISDGYSETSSAIRPHGRPDSARSGASYDSYNSRQGPPRPPKVRDNEPLVPQRPPKVAMTPPGSRQATYVDHVNAARAGSPAFDKSPISAFRSSPAGVRKPSGPRPITISGPSSKGQKGNLNTVKKTRFRGSPNHISSDEDLTL